MSIEMESIKGFVKGIEDIASDFAERCCYIPMSIVKLEGIASDYKCTVDDYLKSYGLNAELVIENVGKESGSINLDCHFEAHDEYAEKYLRVLDMNVPEDDVLTWEKLAKEIENGL